MCALAVHWGWLDIVPGFPDRLRENPPRQGFFEHPEYLAVRAHLPAPWQDILDLAYYSGWRKQEILGLTVLPPSTVATPPLSRSNQTA